MSYISVYHPACTLRWGLEEDFLAEMSGRKVEAEAAHQVRVAAYEAALESMAGRALVHGWAPSGVLRHSELWAGQCRVQCNCLLRLGEASNAHLVGGVRRE